RVDDSTRKDVRPDLRALFEQADRNLLALGRRALLQPDRRREACRSAADDDDVIGHRFAFAHGFLPFPPFATLAVRLIADDTITVLAGLIGRKARLYQCGLKT